MRFRNTDFFQKCGEGEVTCYRYNSVNHLKIQCHFSWPVKHLFSFNDDDVKFSVVNNTFERNWQHRQGDRTGSGLPAAVVGREEPI
jgi:hypothetical protein